jgi:hypothetical protein
MSGGAGQGLDYFSVVGRCYRRNGNVHKKVQRKDVHTEEVANISEKATEKYRGFRSRDGHDEDLSRIFFIESNFKRFQASAADSLEEFKNRRRGRQVIPGWFRAC